MNVDEDRVITKPHPPGFHKSESAREACWACSENGLLDMGDSDWLEAERLIEEGWHSTSARARHLTRVVDVPPFEQAITFHPNVPEWLRYHVKVAFDCYSGEGGARQYGHRPNVPQVENRTVSPAVYRAFKKLGSMWTETRTKAREHLARIKARRICRCDTSEANEIARLNGEPEIHFTDCPLRKGT